MADDAVRLRDAIMRINDVIVECDTNAWVEGERDDDPLWRALSRIDAIVQEARR